MHDLGAFEAHNGVRERPGQHALAALAARQHGVVAHRQLLELGLGTRAIQYRVGAGRLHRIHLGVYALGHRAISAEGRTLHRVRHLHLDDRVLRRAIPVTSVARTLLDLAELLHPRELERAFEEAERLRLLDVGALEEFCRRSRGRRGLRRLRAVVAEQRAPVPATRSELERRFLDVCRGAGLPRPMVNVPMAGFEVDAVWADRRLVV